MVMDMPTQRSCIGDPRTDWLYQTAAEPGLHGRSLRVRAARG